MSKFEYDAEGLNKAMEVLMNLADRVETLPEDAEGFKDPDDESLAHILLTAGRAQLATRDILAMLGVVDGLAGASPGGTDD